jgi:hypothetical protein
MVKAKCIQKFRDNSNRIVGYRLIDQCGNTKDVEANNLKYLIIAGNLDVINLKLTQDNRLIDSAENNNANNDNNRNAGNNLENYVMTNVKQIEHLVGRCDVMYCMKAYFLKQDLTEFEGVLEEAIEVEADGRDYEQEAYDLLDRVAEYKKTSNKPILVKILMHSLSKCVTKTDKIHRLYRAFTSQSIKDRVGIPVDNWLGKTISMTGYTSTTMSIDEVKQYAQGELGYGSEGKVAILDIDVNGPLKCIPLGKPPEDTRFDQYEIGLINPKFRIKSKVRDSSQLVIYKADLVL